MPYKAIVIDANALPDRSGRAFYVVDRLGADIAHTVLSPQMWRTRWRGDDVAISQAIELVERTMVDLISEFDLPLRATEECTIEVYDPNIDNGDETFGAWILWLDIRACVQKWFDDLGGDLIRDIINELVEDDDKNMTDAEINELNQLNDNYDEQFAACMQATKYIFDTIQSFCDLLDAAAELYEAAVQMSGIVGDIARRVLPVGRIVDIALEIVEFGTSLITAQLTEANQLDYACRLFCLVSANGGNIDNLILDAWVDDILHNYDLSNSAAAIGVAFVCTSDFVGNAGNIFDDYSLIDRRQVLTFYAVGLRRSDDRWEVVCSECIDDTWEHTFDFTVSDCGWIDYPKDWTANSEYGQAEEWILGVGWQAGWYTSNPSYKSSRVDIHINCPSITIKEVELEYALGVPGNWNRGTISSSLLYRNVEGVRGTLRTYSVVNTLTGTEVVTWSNSEGVLVTGLGINQWNAYTSGTIYSKSQIKRLTVRGIGTNPFI